MMNTESYATEIADGLSAIHRRKGSAQFFVVLLREFAKGKAVSRQTLRIALGWPEASDTPMLGAMPDIEYDDRGDIVGYGIPLDDIPHAFKVDRRSFFPRNALVEVSEASGPRCIPGTDLVDPQPSTLDLRSDRTVQMTAAADAAP